MARIAIEGYHDRTVNRPMTYISRLKAWSELQAYDVMIWYGGIVGYGNIVGF